MTPLRAIIVDDELLSRRALRQLLERRDDVVVVAERGDAVDLDPATLEADVVFMDVEMPERSGMAVASDWPVGGPALVFVTAFEAYAPTAFDTEAVDYLTKPVTAERLERALERVRRLRPTLPVAPARLVARVGDRETFLEWEAIEAIEADGVYVAVHAEGRRHLIRHALDALEAELPAGAFLRVHRSWIVRRLAVARIERDRATRIPQLRLHSGLVVPVSRRRSAAVARALRG
jgi:two-component system LytT family response regulator